MVSASAAPHAAPAAMEIPEPRARWTRALTAAFAAVVVAAVPVIPVGQASAGTPPAANAHAREKAPAGGAKRAPAGAAGESNESKKKDSAAHRKARPGKTAARTGKRAAPEEEEARAAPVRVSAAKKDHEEKKEKRTAARASASKRRATKATGKDAPPKPCLGTAIQIDRAGLEPERLALVDCAGKPREEARRALSVLARPWGAPRPTLPPLPAPRLKPAGRGAKASAAEAVEIAPRVRLVDPGLLSRIDALAHRYPGRGVSLVSGYRPQSRGSLHQSARAIDLRFAGVRNEELAAACRALPDTGCGYYPNSSFVHVDVRTHGTGSVTWIDASGPGEPPRYVTAWPPPPDEAKVAATDALGDDGDEVLRRERLAAPDEAAGAQIGREEREEHEERGEHEQHGEREQREQREPTGSDESVPATAVPTEPAPASAEAANPTARGVAAPGRVSREGHGRLDAAARAPTERRR